MIRTSKAGQRIGDWFLWIDCEVAKTDSYRKVPLVTLRKAITGGDVISTVVATNEMANELRSAAKQIDDVIDALSADQKEGAA